MKTRTFTEFIRTLLEALNKSKLPYAVTGALAASYYGTPRTTVDADFIIQIPGGGYEKLLTVLDEAGLRPDRRKVKRQLASGYNIISIPDRESSHTADFIIQTRGKLERRAGTLLGIKAYYQTPEALVLAKLRMIKATLPRERSLKDREDIRAILRNTRVDKPKIVRTARRETTLTIFQDALSTQLKSLQDLRGAFKGHEKAMKQAIRELEREHREEAQD